jgi:ABC-type xylose transport system permease subunit
VGKYLQVLGLQTFSPHSRTTSATTSTGYIPAGITIPVALYLLVFTCGEKAYIAKQKKRHG